jgi:hypothetical protein
MDPLISPDGRTYWSDQHGLWLPLSSRPPSPAAPASPPAVAEAAAEGATTGAPAEAAAGPESAGATAAARILALVTCGLIAFVLLLLADGLPRPLPELLAAVPVLFVDYVASAAEARKIRWPASLGDLLRTRTWYLAGIGYAALLVIAADLEYIFLKLAGGSVLELGLLELATGAVMGVLIGWQLPGRPVWTIVETAFLAALLGTVFDLAVLGSRQFRHVHGGASPAAVVLENGAVFAVTGLLGYLGLRAVRRLRPPRLLASPDGRQVWDGRAWRQVGPDSRSYWDGKTWVTFTPR